MVPQIHGNNLWHVILQTNCVLSIGFMLCSFMCLQLSVIKTNVKLIWQNNCVNGSTIALQYWWMKTWVRWAFGREVMAAPVAKFWVYCATLLYRIEIYLVIFQYDTGLRWYTSFCIETRRLCIRKSRSLLYRQSEQDLFSSLHQNIQVTGVQHLFHASQSKFNGCFTVVYVTGNVFCWTASGTCFEI